VIDLVAEPGRKPEVLVHDDADPTGMMALVYARMDHPEFPVPLGVFRAQERPVFDELAQAQGERATAKAGKGDLKKLLHAGDVWTVK
jgi:2-oxoglutarate ferredoxin oxidoreductase subunit beta